MDFHSLSRKELQALCKKNKIPANMTNVAMADALKALLQVDGMEGIEEQFMSPLKPELFTPRQPRTSTRSSARQSSIAVEATADMMERRSVTRSTRRTVKKEKDVKEITSGIAFIKISDTPSAATSRKAPTGRQTAKKSVPQKNDMESKEIGAYPKDLTVTLAITGRRSSARLRSKVTIGSQTPMAVNEETIEENEGRVTRTRQSSRSQSELSLAKEIESASEIEETKLLFPDEIKEQPAAEIELNLKENVDRTVAANSENAEEPISSIPENEEVEIPVPVVAETLDIGERFDEILVTPFCCDDEFKEEAFNADSGNGDDVDENTGEVEFDELQLSDEESLEDISYENAAAIESEEPSRPDEEEITVEVELSVEIPAIVGKVESDELYTEVEGSLQEISCDNVAAVELEELSNNDEEETVEVESNAETPAIICEVKEGGAIDIPAESSAALEEPLSPIRAEAIAVTENLEAGGDVEGGAIDIPAESSAALKEQLSLIRPEAAIGMTENLGAGADVVTTNLSETTFELSELFSKATTSETKTPISAKQHLFVLQDRLPTSAKKSIIKREKTVDENRAADAADKENIGFNCNNNTTLFVKGDKKSAMEHQEKEGQDLNVMSLRQLKLQYKKMVLSKKNPDSTTNTTKKENTVEKKRAALTPLKENCMRILSN